MLAPLLQLVKKATDTINSKMDVALSTRAAQANVGLASDAANPSGTLHAKVRDLGLKKRMYPVRRAHSVSFSDTGYTTSVDISGCSGFVEAILVMSASSARAYRFRLTLDGTIVLTISGSTWSTRGYIGFCPSEWIVAYAHYQNAVYVTRQLIVPFSDSAGEPWTGSLNNSSTLITLPSLSNETSLAGSLSNQRGIFMLSEPCFYFNNSLKIEIDLASGTTVNGDFAYSYFRTP